VVGAGTRKQRADALGERGTRRVAAVRCNGERISRFWRNRITGGARQRTRGSWVASWGYALA